MKEKARKMYHFWYEDALIPVGKAFDEIRLIRQVTERYTHKRPIEHSDERRKASSDGFLFGMWLIKIGHTNSMIMVKPNKEMQNAWTKLIGGKISDVPISGYRDGKERYLVRCVGSTGIYNYVAAHISVKELDDIIAQLLLSEDEYPTWVSDRL